MNSSFLALSTILKRLWQFQAPQVPRFEAGRAADRMMAKIFRCCLVVAFAFVSAVGVGQIAEAAAPQVVWAKRVGVPPNNSGNALGVAVDASGNSYVIGSGYPTLSLPGMNFPTNTSRGISFLAKFDHQGRFLWGTGFPTNRLMDGTVLGVTPDGQSYCLLFSVTRDSYVDTYCLQKRDADGRLLWELNLGSNFRGDTHVMAVDPAGNCLLGGTDGYQLNLVKVTPSGARVWGLVSSSQVLDTSSVNYPNGVSLAADGSAYLLASFKDRSITLGSVTVTNSFAGWYNRDVLLARIRADGSVEWMKNLGGKGTGSGIAAGADAVGNCYILVGQSDGVYLAKASKTGVFSWSKNFPWSLNLNSLDVSPEGNLLLSGWPGYEVPSGTVLSVESATIVTSGGLDALVAKFDSNGVFRWAMNFGSKSNDFISKAVWDKYGTITLAGDLGGPALIGDLSLDPLPGSSELFIARYSDNGPLQPSISLPSPTPKTVIAGGGISLVPTVRGVQPMNLQWRFNGDDLAGHTNSTLTLNAVRTDQAGSYSLVASNLYGMATSAPVVLSVHFSLTLGSDGAGSVSAIPALSDFAPLAFVTLTAVPKPGNQFAGWIGADPEFENPLVIRMDSNRSVRARFVDTRLKLAVSGGSGTITKSPDKDTYALGESVTLTAAPARWNRFVRWGDDPGAGDQRRVVIGANNSYTALFTATQTLETVSLDGIVRVGPIGMPIVRVDEGFVTNSHLVRLQQAVVTVESTYPSPVIFYTLDGSEPTPLSRIYDGPILLRQSKTIRALAYNSSFSGSAMGDPVEVEILPQYTLLTEAAGGGRVTLTPQGPSFAPGTEVTLEAQPFEGWSFLQWLGDASGEGSARALRMVRNEGVRAMFGTGVQVTAVGGGAVRLVPSEALYPFGAEVTVVASPAPGKTFVSWGGALQGTNNPGRLIITNSLPKVAALFTDLAADEYSLNVVPVGGGAVSVLPKGNRFRAGRTVTLTAEPANGAVFAGWSGDASGTNNPISITMTRSSGVEARFVQSPRLGLPEFGASFEGGGFRVWLTGEIGAGYFIERSVNGWNEWRPVATVTNRFGILQWLDPGGLLGGEVYYRANRVP